MIYDSYQKIFKTNLTVVILMTDTSQKGILYPPSEDLLS